MAKKKTKKRNYKKAKKIVLGILIAYLVKKRELSRKLVAIIAGTQAECSIIPGTFIPALRLTG